MVARRWDDQRLIEVAKVVQKAMAIGQKPQLKVEPTAEVNVQIPILDTKDLSISDSLIKSDSVITIHVHRALALV